MQSLKPPGNDIQMTTAHTDRFAAPKRPSEPGGNGAGQKPAPEKQP